MQTGSLPLLGWKTTASPLVLLAAFCAGHSAVRGQELAPTKASDQRPLLDNPMAGWGSDFTNWVELSVGNFFVDGNKAEFRRRHGLPATAFGGIENFHWEAPLTKEWLLQLDGRGIFDNHDYAIRFDVNNPKKGFVRGGYREFRTWYNRHGGFSPLGNVWLTPFDPNGWIDRGEAWVEGGLTLPELPKFTFGYSHIFRDGSKDATTWGDYNLNIGQAGTARQRSLVPAFWDIDEERDIFRLDMTHGIGNTGFGLGLRYEIDDQDNRRNILRRPGERPPLVTPGAERAVTQKDQMDTDMFNVHAFTETRFNEKVLLTSGYAFTTLDTDISGSRIYGADFDPVYDPTFARRQPFDEGFLNLSGGSQLQQYLLNVNLLVTPWDNLSFLPALRVEKWDQDGTSSFTETTVGPAPARLVTEEALSARNDHTFLDVSESFEARYTGLRDWSFYARGEWLEGDGTLKENEIELATGARALFRNTDSERFTQKYSAGANWYPLPRLNFAAQYYHKIRDNEYNHLEDSTSNLPTSGNRYPAFLLDQNFKTDDINFRITWRPRFSVTLVTRYDFQLSSIDTTVPFLDQLQTAEVTTHIISESVSWSPTARLYLQGTLNYVLDATDTPANVLPGDLSGLVLRSENNYWNATFLTGLVLNEKTDLQAQYFYYRADNYHNNSTFSQPYDAGAEENGVTGTLIRRISKALRWTLKYGFFSNHEQTYGGHTDYRAHLVYSTIQYRF